VWLCPAAQKVLPSQIEKPTFSPLDPPTYRDRYCWPGNITHGSACWTVLNDFEGYFEMWSDFGTADEVYGQLSYAAEYTLAGSLVNVRPVSYRATFDTEAVTFEGNALDACGGQTGSAIPNAYGFSHVGTVAANTSTLWNPNGYTNYNGDHGCKSIEIQWSFVVPEYPDTTYYLYAKSPVMWSLDNDPLYRFHGTQPNDLPADFFGGR